MKDVPFDADGPDVLSADVSRALLATVTLGRIVYSDRALPFAVPVTFALDKADVAIRVGHRSRLATQSRGSVVAFQADDIATATYTGWSVLITGRLEFVEDPAQTLRLDALGLRSWVPASTDVYLRLRPKIIAGRRLRALDDADGADGADDADGAGSASVVS